MPQGILASYYKSIAMRTFISLIALFLFGNMAVAEAAVAVRLDGLWRNDRENISVRIESTNQGIRAKRLDQNVWHFYAKKHEGMYSDGQGNFYEVRGNNEIMWRSASSNKQILFERVTGDQSDNHQSRSDWQTGDTDDRNGDGRRDDDRRGDDDWYGDRDDRRYDDDCKDDRHYDRNDGYGNRGRFSSLNGEWYSQNGRRTIDIRPEQNGLRVYREDGRGMLFAPTRDSKIFKSRRGDTIAWLNANTLQLKTTDRHNFIFHRGGNGEIRGNGHGKSNGHVHGNGHAKGHAHGNGKAKGHLKKS